MTKGTGPPSAGVADQLPPFLNLPPELMLQIFEMLTVPELRVLGRANRGFHSFIADYLPDTCYKSKLFRLPTDILKKIATYLFSDPRSRTSILFPNGLARTSQKFYPALMEHAVHLAIENGTNHFLYRAIKYNDLKAAPKLLRLGADIQGEDNYRGRQYYQTPLAFAAQHGHEAMVRVLLDAGAGQGKGNARRALIEAIAHGHESIALLLWTVLNLHDPDIPLWYGPHSFAHEGSEQKELLSFSCKAGFTTLSRAILQRHDLLQWRQTRVEIRTCILLNILHNTDRRDDYIVQRPLPHNLHFITKVLLESGADPDMVFDTDKYYNIDSEDGCEELPGSIQIWASKSSDPRLRDLLLRVEGTHSEEPDETSVLIGGLTRVPRNDKAWDMINAYWEEDVDPDLRLLGTNKRRIVKGMPTRNGNRHKIKSRRQTTRDRPAHRQGQAYKRWGKHNHQILHE